MGQVRESWDHVFSGTEHANTEHITSINIDNTIKTQIQTDLGRTIDFNNINPNDQQALITWFKDNGYSLNNATNEIFRITTIPGG